MALVELLTALVFYLPFVFILIFAFFGLAIGFFTIFSGTLLVLLLAAYGLYALLRDTGIVSHLLRKTKRIWGFLSKRIQGNLQRTFLLKNLELVPQRNALYICHPHGLFGYSWLLHFCYGISEWPLRKPVLAIHSILFRIPFVRDIAEQMNCIEAKECSIIEYLNKGESVAILTGGIEEMVYNGEEEVKLVLKKRKGYARIAKHCRVPIVPLYTHGENELFPTESFWLWRQVRGIIRKWTGLEIPLPSWSSMKQWIQILHKPLDTSVETFVLGVIDTEDGDEAKIRKRCIDLYDFFFQKQKLTARIIS